MALSLSSFSSSAEARVSRRAKGGASGRPFGGRRRYQGRPEKGDAREARHVAAPPRLEMGRGGGARAIGVAGP